MADAARDNHGDRTDDAVHVAVPDADFAALDATDAALGPRRVRPLSAQTRRPVIHLIEDNILLLEVERSLLEEAGWEVRDYHSAEAFLAQPSPTGEACLVVDVNLPGMSGVELLDVLRAKSLHVPAVMLTGRGDAATAVAALKAGAVDYIEKTASWADLLAGVARALELSRDAQARQNARETTKARFTKLTGRERDVMMKVLAGLPNKNIASDLKISQRTVENHRASVMRKTGAESLPTLVSMFLGAGGDQMMIESVPTQVRAVAAPRRTAGHQRSGRALEGG